MRKQLGKFIEFSKEILPHEIEYLWKVNRLQDPDRLRILEALRQNSQQVPPGEDFDPDIDKRTYSHLKNWILKQLAAIDVDQFYSWISELDIKIVDDSISPTEERALLKALDEYAHPGFYFTKLFEVLQNYSNFLLIRLRYKDHERVNAFLERRRADYLRHKEVQERLQQASAVIVREYNSAGEEGRRSRDWLSQVFEDESLQGYSRYQSLIRLHYIDLREAQNQDLLRKYDEVGRYFEEGRFYSKRLLINYYHNRMLLSHKARDYQAAVRFGRLATRVKTHDYLLYVNNLCDVLVHQGRYAEGLELLRSAAKDARQTNNYFNRVGFVAFYMRCQIGQGDPKSAASYGSSFLAVYRREIQKYRWYRFYSTYLEALLRSGQQTELLKEIRKSKLLDREAAMQDRPDFLPRLSVLDALARHLLGEADDTELATTLQTIDPQIATRLRQGDLAALDRWGMD